MNSIGWKLIYFYTIGTVDNFIGGHVFYIVEHIARMVLLLGSTTKAGEEQQ